jgi:hypothetical protein
MMPKNGEVDRPDNLHASAASAALGHAPTAQTQTSPQLTVEQIGNAAIELADQAGLDRHPRALNRLAFRAV